MLYYVLDWYIIDINLKHIIQIASPDIGESKFDNMFTYSQPLVLKQFDQDAQRPLEFGTQHLPHLFSF